MSAPTPDAIGAEQITELRRLEAKATEGPWRLLHPDAAYTAVIDADLHPVALAGDGAMTRTDALFIAASRNCLPHLFAELDRLRARIARGLALHHGVPDLSCPCGTLRCEACGEATPCSTEVALAEQGGQTP